MKTAIRRKKDTSRNTDEPVYRAEEFAGRPLLFGTSGELILAALKESGWEEGTMAEARKIVREFQERKVI